MKHLVKKKKNIILGILFIAIIVCTPFLFGEEGCDDGLNEVANSVDQNIQNGGNSNNGTVNVQANPYGLSITADDIRGLLQLQKTHTITEAQATEIALKSARSLDENANARTERSVSGVSTIYYSNGEKTTNARVTEDDPNAFPVYVVNYANDLGFTIVGGDERLRNPVIFEAEKGNYNGETSESKEFEFIAKRIPAYIGKEIEKENRIRDSILVVVMDKINANLPDNFDITLSINPNAREACWPICEPIGSYSEISEIMYTPLEITGSVGPLINLTWGQCTPYNDFMAIGLPGCPGNGCGNLYPSGCVATAIAMLAAYHERPLTYTFYTSSIHTFNWAGIKSTPNANNLNRSMKLQVSRLFNRIGEAENPIYGCNGTGASSNLNFLRNNGYTVPEYSGYHEYYNRPYTSSVHPYTESAVISSLNNSKPVIAFGQNATRTFAHMWLLDGYRDGLYAYQHRYTLYSSRTLPRTVLYDAYIGVHRYITRIHCNWGWDGDANGYITDAVFETVNRNYSTDVRMYPNITPPTN